MEPKEQLSRQQRRELERQAKKNPEKSTPLSDIHVLTDESRRLGIAYSPKEQALWSPYEVLTPDAPLPQDYHVQTFQKVAQALVLMKDSTNPALNQTSTYLHNLVDAQKLFFTTAADIPLAGKPDENLEGGMATSLIIVDNQLAAHIQVPAKLTLHKETALMVGFDLVHEEVHVRKIFEHYEQFGRSRDIREYVGEENRHDDLNRVIPEEAEAFGAQMEAVIQQFGRGQFKLYNNTLKDAATYVRLGKNFNDPRWHSHLKAHNLSYLNR